MPDVRVALVTPWFGRELIGGAERHAWELAHALAHVGAEVDVLATCCRSFDDDWSSNFHRAGEARLAERLRLLRFRVDSRDRVAFGRTSAALTSLPQISLRGDRIPLDERHARTFVSENINSRALLVHLREHADAYDAVLFMPYLYGPTLTGIAQVADRAFLIPCLHDEAYAYTEPVRRAFAACRGILFNSPGEEETAAAIYGPGILAKSRVVGEAVEPVVPPRLPVRIGSFAPNRARYVLYLGKQVAAKNIDFLVGAYELFRERRVATSLQLVLAGPTNVSRSDDGVVDVGPVSEETKAALLTYARALAQPSLNESFSRAVYESWFARRPVVVHRRCRATARAVEDSGGGWIGSSVEDWARIFAEIDESADDAVDALGERGWAAAIENGNWDEVARRVLDALDVRLRRVSIPSIDQAVPLGEKGAAAYAVALGMALRDAGGDTTTVVAESGERRPGATLVVHASSGTLPPQGDAYVVHHGEAPLVPRHGPLFAVAHEVAARLEERGFPARVLHQPVSPAAWDGVRPPDERWGDGRPALLSIAPLGPGEAQQLLDVFVAYLGSAGDARLLVFARDCDAGGRETLVRERAELDLVDEVVLVGDELAERYAAYRAATVALAVGRPLDVEAAVMPLWFDVPVVALGDPVAVETIEAAGLIEDRFEPRRFAALLRLVAGDERLRAAMCSEGRRTRERHAPWSVVTSLLDHLPRTNARSIVLEERP